MTRLRFAVSLSPPARTKRLANDALVTFVPMEAIRDGIGGIDCSRTVPLSEVQKGSYSYFEEGDVLLAKVTPCFENGKKGLAGSLENSIGFATSEVHVIRPNYSRIDRKFLIYLVSSETFRSDGMKSMTGAGGLKRISAEAILNHRMAITDRAEQSAIAGFLDRETARIDTLIEKKSRFIELLKEKRTATITHAVTKGVNPDVPMKDSGVEWLGEVPEHWSSGPLKYLARLVTGMTPPTADYDNYAEDGFPWVRPEDISEGGEPVMASKFLSDKGRSMARHVAPCSVLICCIGTIGKTGMVYQSVSTNQQITAAESRSNPRYLYFVTVAARIELETMATGNVLRILNTERLGAIKYPIPPLGEQATIATFLDHETTRIDTLISLTERSIELLKEKRSALITAAVTGKIDVREAA